MVDALEILTSPALRLPRAKVRYDVQYPEGQDAKRATIQCVYSTRVHSTRPTDPSNTIVGTESAPRGKGTFVQATNPLQTVCYTMYDGHSTYCYMLLTVRYSMMPSVDAEIFLVCLRRFSPPLRASAAHSSDPRTGLDAMRGQAWVPSTDYCTRAHCVLRRGGGWDADEQVLPQTVSKLRVRDVCVCVWVRCVSSSKEAFLLHDRLAISASLPLSRSHKKLLGSSAPIKPSAMRRTPSTLRPFQRNLTRAYHAHGIEFDAEHDAIARSTRPVGRE